MMVIRESNMNFIIAHEEQLFQIEKSKLMKSLGNGLKRVEFIAFDPKGRLIFVEAKPAGFIYSQASYSYEKRIQELVEKFENSMDLFFGVLSGRLPDLYHDVGDAFFNVDYSKIKIICYVVMKGSKDSICKAVTLRLQEALRRRLQIYKIQVVAIHHKTALQYGLIEGDLD